MEGGVGQVQQTPRRDGGGFIDPSGDRRRRYLSSTTTSTSQQHPVTVGDVTPIRDLSPQLVSAR